jgi:quinoprotein glucose dehydrogenase
MNNESKANISKGPSRDTSPPVIAWLTILFALLAGLYLLTGGIWLVMMGGSPYYIVAGIVLLAVAWLIYRGNGLALSLYALLLIGTLIWAVFEAGFDFWALAPRTDILVLFGIWLLLPFVFRLFDVSARRGGAVALLVCLVLTGVALAYAAFNDPQEINGKVVDNAAVSPATGRHTAARKRAPAIRRSRRSTRTTRRTCRSRGPSRRATRKAPTIPVKSLTK